MLPKPRFRDVKVLYFHVMFSLAYQCVVRIKTCRLSPSTSVVVPEFPAFVAVSSLFCAPVFNTDLQSRCLSLFRWRSMTCIIS